MMGLSLEIFSYQQFIESLPLPAYACNKEGYVAFYNKDAAVLFGRKPIPGEERWEQCWRASYANGAPINLEALAASGQSDIEMMITHPDGSTRHLRLFIRNVEGMDGRTIGSTHIVTDITAERIKEEKAALLAAIVQSSEDAVISKTLDGIITSWNEGASRIFGYRAEEMIGQPVTKLIPPDRQEEEPAILEKLKSGERVEHFQTKRMTKNGQLIDISLTISPVMDSSGVIIGASKVARNITSQIEAARKEREREQLFRMTVETTNIGSWEFHTDGMRLEWSHESRRMWGIETGALISHEYLASLAVDNDWELLRTSAFDAMQGDGHFTVKFRIRRADNQELRWMKVQGKVLFGENGEADRFIGTMLDITSDKHFTDRLEEIVSERTSELVTLNHQLKRSNHDLEQFAYIASHDLQEPLRKIQTFGELIERNLENPATLEHYARRIRISTRRMSNLIRDVLNYSRLSKVPGRLEDVSLDAVLKDALQSLHREIILSGASIVADPLPVIKGNYDQLYQLFHNVINNALKFCNTAPVVKIRVSRTEDDLTEISVQDNGIGFEQHYAEKIFHIFSHLNPIEQYNGTGIGLALCRKIVENHGGTISASGAPGEGAIFRISLPC